MWSICKHIIHVQLCHIQSSGLPACLIGKCCSSFCSWLALVPLLSCCAFLLRLNQGHPPLVLLVLVLVLRLLDYYDYDDDDDDDDYYYYYYSSYSYSYSYANTYSDSFTPLLLPPCFPKFYTGSAGSQWHCIQHYRRLQVLVTGRTRY